MKLTRLIISLFALLLLLPAQVSAQEINVYPGPDDEWNYLYDYGDVEVGQSAVMIFQIENDLSAHDDLIVYAVELDGSNGPFAITGGPIHTVIVEPGDSIYVEVTFTPPTEDFFEGIMSIVSNASNTPPGGNIPYALQGVGVGDEPGPEELMKDVMDYFEAGLADGTIYGLGSGRAHAAHVRVFRNMLDAADDLIAAGDFEGACKQLWDAVVKSDGDRPPPDFIGGTGVDTLNSMLLDVLDALGC